MSVAKTNYSGFTLVEMLVALVILSIGFLGVAGLQAVSLRSGHDAVARSYSSFHAYSLIESIHAHSRGVLTDFEGDSPSVKPSCDSSKSAAADERNCFFNKVMSDLPGGKASISQQADGNYLIQISWFVGDEAVGSAANVQQQWVVVP